MFRQMEESLLQITKIYRQIGEEFTIEELSKYDGRDGRPAYVAVNGIVYDVSNEATWGGASHFGLIAGKDLTSAFNGCHGRIEVLSKLPKVGVIKRGTSVGQ